MAATRECLRRHGIVATPITGDYGFPDGLPLALDVINSQNSTDAIFVFFKQKTPGRDFEVDEMYIYRGWQTESKKPKGKRQADLVDLNTVNVDELAKWINGQSSSLGSGQ
jgi:hypothetical protein